MNKEFFKMFLVVLLWLICNLVAVTGGITLMSQPDTTLFYGGIALNLSILIANVFLFTRKN